MGFSLLITTTGSRKEAENIGKSLVTTRLAACVNVIPGVNSFFYWQGKLCREKEFILLIKTKDEKNREIINIIKRLHSYETPEIIRLKVAGGDRRYLDWVKRSIK